MWKEMTMVNFKIISKHSTDWTEQPQYVTVLDTYQICARSVTTWQNMLTLTAVQNMWIKYSHYMISKLQNKVTNTTHH